MSDALDRVEALRSVADDHGLSLAQLDDGAVSAIDQAAPGPR